MNKLFFLVPVFSFALGGHAAAKTCEVEIESNDMIQFDKSEIVVSSDCDQVEVTLTHSGELPVTQMGHNWVLAKTEQWEELAQDAMLAGPENDYLPPDDDRALAHTDMIGGGQTTGVTFDLSELDKDEDYTFFCSFPGHAQIMNGKFKIE